MKNELIIRLISVFLILNACQTGADKFFNNFYSQANGNWKSEQITVLSSNSKDLIPNDLRIKLTPCTASPCSISISLDNADYIDLQYNLGNGNIGTSQSSKLTAMVFSFNRYRGSMDSLSEKEVFFVENIQTFFIDQFSESRLNASINFQDRMVVNAVFVPE